MSTQIVEEALRAMRDEAREHVLSIKSSDLVLNRLLGSGRLKKKKFKNICYTRNRYTFFFLIHTKNVEAER